MVAARKEKNEMIEKDHMLLMLRCCCCLCCYEYWVGY